MARDGLGVIKRAATHGGSALSINRTYDPAKQVSTEDLRRARATLAAMLDGGELLPQYQGPWLRQAITVLDESIAAAEWRASRS